MSTETLSEFPPSAGRLQSRLARKTARNLALYLPTVFVRGTIGLISASLLTKLFLPEDYGNYALAFVVYSQLIVLTGGWLSQSIIRLTLECQVKNQFEKLVHSLVASELVLLGLVSCLSLITLLLTRTHLEPKLFQLLLVALVGAFFTPLVGAAEQYFRIVDRTVTYCLLALFQMAFSLSLGLLLAVPCRLGVIGFFVGYITPSIAIVAFLALTWRKRLYAIFRSTSFSGELLKDALAYSAPLVAMNLMSSVVALSDRYFIGWFQGAHDVAIYSLSYLVANQSIVFTILLLTLAGDPIAVRTWEEEGPEGARDYLNQMSRYFSLLAVPALFGLIVLRTELIRLLATPEYLAGAPVIVIVGLGVLFSGYSQICNRVFGLRKRTLIPLLTFGFAALLNVVLNFLLVPTWGFMAAAWTTLLAYVVLFCLNFLEARRMMPLRFLGSYAYRALAASVVMSAFVLWSKSLFPGLLVKVVASIAIGACVYAGMLLLLGEVETPFSRAVSCRFKRLLVRLS